MTVHERLAQHNRLKDCISRVTYKPDYTLSIEPFKNDDYVFVLLIAEVQSAVPPHGKFKIRFHSQHFYSHLVDVPDEALVEYIYTMVRDSELHELDEWFRIDGKHLRNPHQDQPEELWKPSKLA